MRCWAYPPRVSSSLTASASETRVGSGGYVFSKKKLRTRRTAPLASHFPIVGFRPPPPTPAWVCFAACR
jgi:hypothetical protein